MRKLKMWMNATILICGSMAGAAQNFRANLDESVKPGDNFRQYAVETWLKNNPLDKEHSINGDPEADYVCNYGAIGTIIGHEISHGFDDEGCQYDKDGNLINWWSDKDKAKFDERTKVLADWFSQQEALPGLNVNGKKTLGENIGDNGGLQIAYRAFENRMKQEPLNLVEGFTPAQRFYLSYARIWASNVTPEYTAMQVNSDVHSPDIFRVNAALPMIDSWYDAFNIQPTDKMFIPKEKRALVWG